MSNVRRDDEVVAEAPVPSGSTPARREDGNPPLASETRYRNKRDRPPPKQTHIPLRGSALEFLSSLSHRSLARRLYAVALLSALALGSHSNYVDFRQPCARENKHFRHTDRKEAPSPRVCSRDLTIPRHDATPAPMSWISTSYPRISCRKFLRTELFAFKVYSPNLSRKRSVFSKLSRSSTSHDRAYFVEFDTFALSSCERLLFAVN